MIDFDSMWAADEGRRGWLVAIEGFDGAGKTTQIGLLRTYLEGRGYSVLCLRQPTEWYREQPCVREYLQSGGSEKSARIAAMLSAVDRLRQVDDAIAPALRDGKVVICDRYVFAAIVLFASRGVSADLVARMNAGTARPDLAVYLDVPAETALSRIARRDGITTKFEERSPEIVEDIMRSYRSLPRREITQIDGTASAEVVHRAICERVGAVLEQRVSASPDDGRRDSGPRFESSSSPALAAHALRAPSVPR